MPSVLCLLFRPKTIHCSTKNAYTSEITFLALVPWIDHNTGWGWGDKINHSISYVHLAKLPFLLQGAKCKLNVYLKKVKIFKDNYNRKFMNFFTAKLLMHKHFTEYVKDKISKYEDLK